MADYSALRARLAARPSHAPPAAPELLPTTRVALDSGAFSLYTKNANPHKKVGGMGPSGKFSRRKADFSFADTDAFKQYLENYIAYLHDNAKHYDFYVVLDVIFNPKKSLEVLRYMESCGLSPMPVLHVGEDLSWLGKFLDRHQYVGVGGLGQDVNSKTYPRFADAVFERLRAHGAHAHGFAMSIPKLMARYPWYSVDATTPLRNGWLGTVFFPFPIMRGGKRVGWDYVNNGIKRVAVTVRRSKDGYYHTRNGEHSSAILREYVEEELETTIDEMQEDGKLRLYANLVFTMRMLDQVATMHEEQGTALRPGYRPYYYMSGGSSSDIDDVLYAAERSRKAVGCDYLRHLLTYYDLNRARKFISMVNLDNGDNNNAHREGTLRRPVVRKRVARK